MLEEQSIKDFSAALMSKSPVPGGGGVSALAGALPAWAAWQRISR